MDDDCFFNKFVNISNTVKIPDDWYIVITDIKDFTSAILKGKYCEVNLPCVVCIAKVRNNFPKSSIN